MGETIKDLVGRLKSNISDYLLLIDNLDNMVKEKESFPSWCLSQLEIGYDCEMLAIPPSGAMRDYLLKNVFDREIYQRYMVEFGYSGTIYGQMVRNISWLKEVVGFPLNLGDYEIARILPISFKGVLIAGGLLTTEDASMAIRVENKEGVTVIKRTFLEKPVSKNIVKLTYVEDLPAKSGYVYDRRLTPEGNSKMDRHVNWRDYDTIPPWDHNSLEVRERRFQAEKEESWLDM